MSHVLVLNSGSSSIKYQLLDMAQGTPVASGIVERIGEGRSSLTHKVPAADPGGETRRYERTEPYADHEAGLKAVLDAFAAAGPDLDAIRPAAVGHRVVHGGDRFGGAVLVDDGVESAIEELAPLAPLHNPANLAGIRGARKAFPNVPQVAVFDTAFHQTLPPAAYTYAVPEEWRTGHKVRRYGFHGTSHAYVSRRAAAILGQDPADTNVIVLHLGNGASATAIESGRSVETSMGLTPLEGLVMGTRSGDVDPSLPAYLARNAGMSAAEVDTALNKRSGVLALAGANDMREVWRMVDEGHEGARLAVDVYCHRLRKYIGAYYAVLGSVDALVFTAGVGENDERVRAGAVAGLERLGLRIDPAKNDGLVRGTEQVISPEGAEVPVMVIPTDEELEIAVQSLELLGR
ncbi:acetate kinase [Nocardiopsis mwathae]|uniref:Acetate kinase n=1 Tax=Nocardiopsis mwathae TaxID=1472723 RepID=A0A7X0D6Q4_9ACTN|nr:acetate kinase [Nocardiopsis mwathae]MBB6172956.1 acetate kinase [Nocardiopsis mwathae]